MTTARDIITGAAKLIGVVRKNEALDGDEAEDGLVSLNDMMASWSNNALNIYARTWETFSVSAAGSYTIGTGQTLNTERPIKIVAAFVRSGGVDYPLTQLTDAEYELGISLKTTGNTIPAFYNYDNGYPAGTIRIFPVLSTAATLGLLTEKQLTAFAALNTTVDLPPGTNKALRYNLALEMAPEYGVQPSPLVVKGAMESLGAIRTAVAKNRALKYSAGYVQAQTIYTGWI